MTDRTPPVDDRFIAYEYAIVPARANQESLLRDVYRSLGWACEAVDRPTWPNGNVSLRLKRDRAILNKPALSKLQRQLETTLETIDHLSRSKTSKASITALTVGICGTAALAGSVFCYLSALWPLFIVLGLIGLIGWVLPYFAFNQIKAAQTATANEEIERQYDQLYAICHQAAALAGIADRP
ncbi:MAG: hypothetical protein LBJ44_06730 [Propionibacteriaceae bacterium]|jgi:Flp pilus assembly protein TadB|nr:hypothetical protein [Propionibacteriaceae bacterium]